MSKPYSIAKVEPDLAEAIVSVLRLEVKPGDINPEAPLFGDGLGLDSIDALEVAYCVWERYGVELRSDDPEIKRIFGSLRNLARHIVEHLAQPAESAFAANC